MAKKKKNEFEIIVRVGKNGSRYTYTEISTGEDYDGKANGIYPLHAKTSFENNLLMGRKTTKAGNTIWRKIKEEDVPDDYSYGEVAEKKKVAEKIDFTKERMTPAEMRIAVANSYALKPDTFVMDELNWKLGVLAVYEGENILTLGYSGCGKTMFARTLAKALNRPFFKFNMGATQDARATLIGNTHYNPEKGTHFVGSEFVKAITTKNAIVLLDELTRMTPDAENIMMPVLDRDQRYLRIDEDPNTPTIEVAEGVTFIATANVGAEFTSTRLIDRATKDRFSSIVEVRMLTEDEEFKLLKKLYPEVNPNYLRAFARIAGWTRSDVKTENPQVQTIISTRSTVEQAKKAFYGGFKFSEIMESMVLPLFSNEGGDVDSERGVVLKVVQNDSHLDNESPIKGEDTPEETKEKEKDANPSNVFDDDDAF